MTETGMSGLLEKLHQFPVLPTVVQEVIHSFDDPNLDASTLAAKISQDQGLATKVLRVANSAFYGLPRQVASIQDTVVVLGFGNVRTLVVAAGLVARFPAKEDGPFDRKQFWRHCAAVGLCARILAKRIKHNQEIAFTAGMLHDIGQMALDVCLGEKFAQVLDRVNSGGAILLEAERELLGFDHAEVGAEVARRWNFPDPIQHAIRYHHLPDHEPFEPLNGIIYLADFLAHALDSGGLVEGAPRDLPDQMARRLGLAPNALNACLDELEEMSSAAGMMAEA